MRWIYLIAVIALNACGATDESESPAASQPSASNDFTNSGSGSSNANPDPDPGTNPTSTNNGATNNGAATNSGPAPNNVSELPPFDGVSPLAGAPAPERMLPELLYSHVEHFSWDPDLNTLYFAVSLGGRASVPKVDDAYLAEHPDAVQEHPYRMWRYQESASGAEAQEFMRLPATAIGRGESHWCKWTHANAEFWCHHNLKKASEAIIRVTGGNGYDVPLEYDSWALSYWDPVEMREQGALHDGMVDLVEASDGTLYWTVKIGIGGSSRSYLVRGVPPLDEPPLLLAKSTEEMDQLHGVALSADESKLYFTTGAYGGEQLGAIWVANVQPDGSIDAPVVLASGVYRPRGLTVDEHDFIYVASGLEIRVFDALGRDVDSVKVVTDHADQESLQNPRSKYSLLSVAFGGADRNILFTGMGYDRKGVENIDGGEWTQGGLYRLPLSVRAP